MKCMICKTDGNRIEPKSSDLFPICVPCIDARMDEIAKMKAAVGHFNETLVDGEPVMTLAEYEVTCDDEPLTDEEYAAIMAE